MFLRIVSCVEPVRRVAGCFRPALRGPVDNGVTQPSRLAASTTLACAAVGAAIALAAPLPGCDGRGCTDRRTAAAVRIDPVQGDSAVAAPVINERLSEVSHPVAAPARIIGAAPRGGNCSEQVWPYIEARCLTRAAENRPDAHASARSPSGRAEAPANLRGRAETTGLASTDAPATPISSAREVHRKSRVATAALSPPPRRTYAAEDAPFAAGPTTLSTGRPDRVFLWQESGAEPSMWREPQRRLGRGAQRSRHRGGRRHLFGFMF